MGLTMCLKITLVVLALITMVVGLYAHYTSEWLKAKEEHGGGDGLYNSCDHLDNVEKIKEELEKVDVLQLSKWKPIDRSQAQTQAALNQFKELEDEVPKNCPAISLEQYFVAAVIICFLGAIVSVVLGFCCKDSNTKKQSTCSKYVDVGLHVVLALLLICGMICCIVSAVQAHDFFNYMNILTKKRDINKGIDSYPWSGTEKPAKPEPQDPDYDLNRNRNPPTSPPSFSIPTGLTNSLEQYMQNLKNFDKFIGVDGLFDLEMNHELKLAAGAIAFLQAIFHLIVSLTVCLSSRSKDVHPGQDQDLPQSQADFADADGNPQQAGQPQPTQQAPTNQGPGPKNPAQDSKPTAATT